MLIRVDTYYQYEDLELKESDLVERFNLNPIQIFFIKSGKQISIGGCTLERIDIGN